jgi:hypothetical protein
MTIPRSETEIAFILEARPRLRLIAKGARDFDFFGDRFEDVGLGEHNGFYDFLRSRKGEIIGLRYLPSAGAESLFDEISAQERGFRFGRDGELRVLFIFLGEDEDFDPETSSDQYFGDNAIYRSRVSGKIAVAFGYDLLSMAERASLKI